MREVTLGTRPPDVGPCLEASLGVAWRGVRAFENQLRRWDGPGRLLRHVVACQGFHAAEPAEREAWHAPKGGHVYSDVGNGRIVWGCEALGGGTSG